MTEKNIDLKKNQKNVIFLEIYNETVAVIKHKGRKINCKGLNGLI